MKKIFFLALALVFLTSALSAQVLKFKSNSSELYENKVSNGRLYRTAYINFDYDKKLITIKSMEDGGTHISAYKMENSIPEKGTIMGDGDKIYVSSTDRPEVLSISINQEMSAIWLDLKNSNIFYVGLTKVQ